MPRPEPMSRTPNFKFNHDDILREVTRGTNFGRTGPVYATHLSNMNTNNSEGNNVPKPRASSLSESKERSGSLVDLFLKERRGSAEPPRSIVQRLLEQRRGSSDRATDVVEKILQENLGTTKGADSIVQKILEDQQVSDGQGVAASDANGESEAPQNDEIENEEDSGEWVVLESGEMDVELPLPPDECENYTYQDVTHAYTAATEQLNDGSFRTNETTSASATQIGDVPSDRQGAYTETRGTSRVQQDAPKGEGYARVLQKDSKESFMQKGDEGAGFTKTDRSASASYTEKVSKPTNSQDGFIRQQNTEKHFSTSETSDTGTKRTEHTTYTESRTSATGSKTVQQNQTFYEEKSSDNGTEETKDLEDICNEISDKLEEVWDKKDEELKKKCVKKMFLKWHPDKNIGKEELCTAVTQHITSEVERLDRGFLRHYELDDLGIFADPRNPFAADQSFKATFQKQFKMYFDQLNTQRKAPPNKAYQEAEEYFNKKSVPLTKAPAAFQASLRQEQREAQSMLTKAEVELKYADNSKKTDKWVVYKAYQAAERALKAAQYSQLPIISPSRDVVYIASTLDDFDLERMAMKLKMIVKDYEQLCDPDLQNDQEGPNIKFTLTREDALDAMEAAADIIDQVKLFFRLKESPFA